MIMQREYAVFVLLLTLTMSGCGASGETMIPIGYAQGDEQSQSGQAMIDTGSMESGSGYDKVDGKKENLSESVYVYVCGCVQTPGVYVLEEGSRAGEALEAAGGYTEEADREYVNLAAKVADGQKLYFPAQGEVLPAAEAEESDGRVNINTASVEELCSLPGIGESRALDIIHYRENAGGFQTCEDIMKVSGIKTSVYNKIKDRIKVD